MRLLRCGSDQPVLTCGDRFVHHLVLEVIYGFQFPVQLRADSERIEVALVTVDRHWRRGLSIEHLWEDRLPHIASQVICAAKDLMRHDVQKN